MKKLSLLLIVFIAFQSWAQKKVLDHSDYKQWKNIANESVSRNGEWITYTLKSNALDNPIVNIHNNEGDLLLSYSRGEKPKISYDSKYIFFTIKPEIDSLNDLKRIKTKKDDLPMDTLAFYAAESEELSKIPRLKNFKAPEKWSGWMAYQYLPEKDTSKAAKKQKKRNKENGFELVIHNLEEPIYLEYPYVTNYTLSEKGGRIAFISSGNDSTFLPGVYVYDTESRDLTPVFRSKGKYKQLTWDESGQNLSFISDLDTTKALIRNYDLHLWSLGQDSASTILTNENDFFGEEYLLSESHDNYFSQDGSKLYFGKATLPIVADTSLLEHEIVNVEVWSYSDPKLHTQQKIDKEETPEQSYLSVYDLASQNFYSLASTEIENVKTSDEGNGQNLIGYDSQPYHQLISWEGFPYYNDFYAMSIDGKKELIASKVRGNPSMSPNGKFAYWFDYMDTAWYSYEFASEQIRQITNNNQVAFYNERHDSPSQPGSYGIASWTENDEHILIYDRYDIWKVDPTNASSPVKLTNGRADRISRRYVRLDDEERFITSGQKLFIRAFDETTKTQNLESLAYKVGASPKSLTSGREYLYRDIMKAQDADYVVFTKENFVAFPDLHGTKNFKKAFRISNANPQQSEYNWGTAELVKWTSLDGIELEGQLIKPENFDPTKKYPLIVNFYEKSADRLHRHKPPSPGRSTISYSFYASRGYLIFNPDVHYREGYPGESAYNCVIPGVTKLIESGFVDKDRIGVQGHSWGGYQIAYLVTKTDLFKCAEAGAPVPNMISAYGGIRWWTGLSRMFQYEHTQSRIGGTLWDYPQRYIENSPIFYIDKINTPVLIMHNDADGHVPWYQGIEFFVSLRRLGKPSWMLNYQGEPHWPLKLQNRIDFNIRLAQYFDYYLKDAPMPKWMDTGVSARDMGINQNLELIDNE